MTQWTYRILLAVVNRQQDVCDRAVADRWPLAAVTAAVYCDGLEENDPGRRTSSPPEPTLPDLTGSLPTAARATQHRTVNGIPMYLGPSL